ncbi:hypothetical protein PT974_07870 [Cladobotryum mycophilum]|uniref:Glycosyltransferase family 69 protein n=1 Tax=Cladobotryum mycophilum TaxID=491253 RepID=A0ABR0SD99_9HYPO
MTDDDTELDSRRRNLDHNRSHDDDRDRDDGYFPKSNKQRYASYHNRLLTLRRYVAPLIHYSQTHHEVVYLFLLPALYFRFFPIILTHNSTTLSAYLAIVLVYIPGKVVLSAWRAYSSSSYMSNGRKRKKSFLLPSTGSIAPSYTSSTSPRSSIEKNSWTRQSFFWLCGALFTLWVYTWGISSPFPTAASVISSSPTLRAQQSRNASYFIAASFWNNEEILDSWTSQTLRLIDSLGHSNVYVSLTENDSEDNTASKLLHFGRELTKRNVTHSVNITSDLRGYPPENPWRSVRHRMGYMANLRNGALKPLGSLNRRFENVIILNDVVYHHTDVLKLIAAIGGDDIYDHTTLSRSPIGKSGKKRMACSVDMDGATLYDAWVLRDRCGRPVSGFWPFFTSEEDKRSVREGRVLNVGTCWNGIVVLDGDMLLEPPLRREDADWGADPLRFQQPPECIISECALLPLTIMNTTGGAPVVLDPTVVVGYSVKWWRYYAVWLRMPVVRLWMRVFEEGYWGMWWRMGMGTGLRWAGLDNGKEKKECVVEGWPKCGSGDYLAKGALKFKSRTDEL